MEYKRFIIHLSMPLILPIWTSFNLFESFICIFSQVEHLKSLGEKMEIYSLMASKTTQLELNFAFFGLFLFELSLSIVFGLVFWSIFCLNTENITKMLILLWILDLSDSEASILSSSTLTVLWASLFIGVFTWSISR